MNFFGDEKKKKKRVGYKVQDDRHEYREDKFMRTFVQVSENLPFNQNEYF